MEEAGAMIQRSWEGAKGYLSNSRLSPHTLQFLRPQRFS
jgi:hypothetical protein